MYPVGYSFPVCASSGNCHTCILTCTCCKNVSVSNPWRPGPNKSSIFELLKLVFTYLPCHLWEKYVNCFVAKVVPMLSGLRLNKLHNG